MSNEEPSRAFEATLAGAGLFDRPGRGLLRLTGPDRLTFLHGQTTNEVNKLVDGAGNEAALLTNKGKMVAPVRVFKRPDDLLVETGPGLGPKVLEHLQRSCISEEVELEDLSEAWGQLGVYGPKAALVLAAAGGPSVPTEHSHVPWGPAFANALVVGSRALGVPGVDVLAPLADVALLRKQLLEAGAAFGLAVGGDGAAELLRIHAGLPRYGVDMTEETNPLEANLERAISYQKGCYVGQEVIAKATFRGHVSRKLAGLVVEGEAPVGTELKVGDCTVGRITSIARFPDGRVRALGTLKRDSAQPGTAVTLTTGVAATVAALPFSM